MKVLLVFYLGLRKFIIVLLFLIQSMIYFKYSVIFIIYFIKSCHSIVQYKKRFKRTLLKNISPLRLGLDITVFITVNYIIITFKLVFICYGLRLPFLWIFIELYYSVYVFVLCCISGALKQGPCTFSIFKASNLTYLHVLSS